MRAIREMEHVHVDAQLAILVTIVIKNVQTIASIVTSLMRPNAILVKVNIMAISVSSSVAKLANKNMAFTNAINRMDRA